MFAIKPPVTQAEVQADVANTVSNSTIASLTTVSTDAILEKPRYTGEDAEHNQWEILGEKAIQQGSSVSGTYVMDRVRALWKPASGSAPMTVHAQRGVYMPTAQTLDLQGGIQAQGEGITLTAPDMQVNLSTRQFRTQTDGDVRVTGVMGQWHMYIDSRSLQGDVLGRTVHMQGGVHAVLTPIEAR